jgi:hypothetical protein
MQTFVARPSLVRLFMMLIASLAFVFFGSLMAGLLGEVPKPGKEWIGWLSLVFFGMCAVQITVRLFDRDDQIIISGLGIYWKQWSCDMIPWSEITKVAVWELKSNKSIILHLRNPQRFQSTNWIGKIAAANRAMTDGDIALILDGTDKTCDEALSAIHYFRPRQAMTNIPAATSAPVGFGKKGF